MNLAHFFLVFAAISQPLSATAGETNPNCPMGSLSGILARSQTAVTMTPELRQSLEGELKRRRSVLQDGLVLGEVAALIRDTLHGRTLSPEAEVELYAWGVDVYLKQKPLETDLARDLIKELTLQDRQYRMLAQGVRARFASASDSAQAALVQAFPLLEILVEQGIQNGDLIERAAPGQTVQRQLVLAGKEKQGPVAVIRYLGERFIALPSPNLAPEVKAEFILHQMGTEAWTSQRLLTRLPQIEQAAVKKAFDRRLDTLSPLVRVLRARAAELGFSDPPLDLANLDTLLFTEPLASPQGGYQLSTQRTPTSQLVYALLMGENLERDFFTLWYNDLEDVVTLTRIDPSHQQKINVRLDPNRGVSANFLDALTLARTINATARKFKIDLEVVLPSAEELNPFLNGGVTNEYSAGNSWRGLERFIANGVGPASPEFNFHPQLGRTRANSAGVKDSVRVFRHWGRSDYFIPADRASSVLLGGLVGPFITLEGESVFFHPYGPAPGWLESLGFFPNPDGYFRLHGPFQRTRNEYTGTRLVRILR